MKCSSKLKTTSKQKAIWHNIYPNSKNPTKIYIPHLTINAQLL